MNKKDLKEAVRLAELLEKLSKPHKLSVIAFPRMAMEIAGTDDSRLDAFGEALKRPHLRCTKRYVIDSEKWVREGTCTCPPRELRRLAWLGRFEEVCSELASIGSNPFEAFAYAAREVAQKHPEKFGTVEDMDAYRQELEDTKQAYATLLEKIRTGYSSEDLIVDNPDDSGYARCSFRITKGAVPLGRDWPQHLINYLRAHPEAL